MEAERTFFRHVPWSRLAAEMLIIVSSILLAFAIEAWWARGQEVRSLRDHEELVVAQLSAVAAQLREEAASAERAREALATAIRVISPDPEEIPTDSLVSLLRAGWGMSDDDIQTSALENLLGLESFEPATRPELYGLMLRFRTDSGLFGRNVSRFVEAKMRTSTYLMTVAPRPTLMFDDPDAGSEFPMPMEGLLRDQRFEGHLRELYERQTVRLRRSESLAALADSITARLGQGDPS